MKKIFILVTILSLLLTPQLAFADSKPSVSLSDAILADLALRNYLDYISIYFVDKKSPNTVSLNPTKQWLPASTVKLYVAMYAFEQIAEKNISLDDWVTIDDKNVVPTELETDEYPVLTPGITTTVTILLNKMITQSDNTAYNTLLDLLGRENITSFIQNIGLQHTIVGSKLNLDDNQTQYEFAAPGYNINTTTAQDYAKAYDLLESNKLAKSKDLLQILAHQKINSMLPAYLPTTLTIEHKTGDLDPLYHDGGIVIGNNRHYILTMFSNLGNPNVLAHISQLIYTRNYSLVGSTIPDKEDTSKPDGLQALDPLVMNPQQNVLAATTPLNIPLPNITAADLGISDNDISLVIPAKNLPKPFLPPLLNNVWFGLQKALVIGEKARQGVVLSYAKSELGRAADLTKNGKSQQATQTLSIVSEVVKQIAKDKTLSPDQSTQVAIKALSDTRFSLMRDQLSAAKNDDTRAQLIQTIAQTARTHLTEVEPHLADAKAATNLAQKPVVGEIITTAPDHIVVQTSGGQQITIPVTDTTKIKGETSHGQPTPTMSPTTQTSPIPSTSESAIPTLSPSEVAPTSSSPGSIFRKGETIAVLGSTKGTVLTPSLIVNNIPREIAAPHPVIAVKVNSKDNTMVVSDNGNLIQVDLSQKTAIKAKDTNVELQSIKPGSIVVVHPDMIEPVHSDSPVTLPTLSVSPNNAQKSSPTTKPTGQSLEKTNQQTPANTVSPQPTQTGSSGQSSPTGSTTTTPSIQPTEGSKTTPIPSGKGGIFPQLSPAKSLTPAPTAIPSATIQPVTKPTSVAPTQPEVIHAKSIQVIQQPSTNSKPSAHTQPSKPQSNHPTQQNQPQQNKQVAQPQTPPSQNTKSIGK